VSQRQGRWILLLAWGLLGLGAGYASAQPPAEPSGLAAAAAIEGALVDVIARAEKSVVAVARVRKPPSGETFPLEFRPDPFGRGLGPSGPGPADPDFVPTEYGTGVVIDRAGLILTAYHVLGQESEYYVTTHDRKVYKAWVKAADPRSDLAVLSIDATNLTPIELGDATGLKKGQLVVALGNPYAIARDGQASAAWGIVSNLSRKAPPVAGAPESASRPTLHHFGTLIQTDAKLNLGTSGGPLLNLEGKMIGLCVALAAVTGFDKGAGYAIPVDDTFRRVLGRLKEGREVEYGFLGIQPINLRPQELIEGLDGIRVDRVVSGTPAARYGLKPGDLITAVNRHPIHEADGLVLEVGRLPVEATARLAVLRDGRRRSIDVVLAKYPVRGEKIVTTRPPDWRGLRVDYPTAYVDDDPAARAGLSFFDDGVVVTEVAAPSPAHQAGLRPGTRITHVGRTPVRTPREFQTATAGQSGPVTLRLGDDAAGSMVSVPES